MNAMTMTRGWTLLNGGPVDFSDRIQAASNFDGDTHIESLISDCLARKAGSLARLQAALVSDSANIRYGSLDVPFNNGITNRTSLFDIANVQTSTDRNWHQGLVWNSDNCPTVTGYQAECDDPFPGLPSPNLIGQKFILKPAMFHHLTEPCDALLIGSAVVNRTIATALQVIREWTPHMVARMLFDGTQSATDANGAVTPHYLADPAVAQSMGIAPVSVRSAIGLLSAELSRRHPGRTGTIYVPLAAYAQADLSTFLVDLGGRRWGTTEGHIVVADSGFSGRAPSATADPLGPVYNIYATLGIPSVLMSEPWTPHLNDNIVQGSYSFPSSMMQTDAATGLYNNRIAAYARRYYMAAFQPCTVLTTQADVTIGTGGGGGGGTVTPSADTEQSEWLCDYDANDVLVGSALRRFAFDSSGNQIQTGLVGVNGLPYTQVGVLRPCSIGGSATTPSIPCPTCI